MKQSTAATVAADVDVAVAVDAAAATALKREQKAEVVGKNMRRKCSGDSRRLGPTRRQIINSLIQNMQIINKCKK